MGLFMKFYYFSLRRFSGVLSYFLVIFLSLVALLLAFSVMVHTVYSGEYIEVIAEPSWPVVVIDAGHGGEDVGAVGVNGVYEKDLNLSYAITLGEMLSEEGYTVFYTRTEDRLLYSEEENIKGMRKIYDLKNRAIIANEKNPLLFVSMHMNHYSVDRYSGFEIYYQEGNVPSQGLAYNIADEVKGSVPDAGNRTPKATDQLYLLSNITCPAVLVECGFLSNRPECERLCEKEYEKQLCFAIVCGIIKYENAAES